MVGELFLQLFEKNYKILNRFFLIENREKYIFSPVFSIKTKILIIFQKSFLLRYLMFLKILENVIQFFPSWTLATSATSRGPNFDLINLSKVSNFSWRYQLSYEILFVDKNENLEALDCGLQNVLPQYKERKNDWP